MAQGHSRPDEKGNGLTLKEHRLAEVTAHVIPTHGLDTEQVKAVRWDMANGGFLQGNKEKAVGWFEGLNMLTF